MSLICVNAGQCGNQLGFDFLNALYDNTARQPVELDMFFREPKSASGKPVARAVCLDTEPKAVLSCLQRSARKVSDLRMCGCDCTSGIGLTLFLRIGMGI